MNKPHFLLALAVATVSACGRPEAPPVKAEAVPWVRTIAVQGSVSGGLVTSGTVRARVETPLAFQVGGRILARRVDAGQTVGAGQVLFELDPRDLQETARAVEAELAAVRAERDTAASELARQTQLLAQGFIGQQAFDRSQLAARATESRLVSAEARLRQANNASGYALLRARSPGVVTEVSGEPGQVVSAGQALGTLAAQGEREIEVFLPDGRNAPKAGSVLLADGSSQPVRLREVAGSADAASRTWRARYAVTASPAQAAASAAKADALALGSVVRVRLESASPAGGAAVVIAVPVGAIDERGGGPRIWRVQGDKATPMPVKLLSIDLETARIAADLPAGARVVAVGTHLLEPGMAVREQPR
ncbi:MAG: efflux RND transporter periplasmic adaptor subunit [Aquabacterium sp.]|nr:efflux RND transporter periplasmic adaptor subunit [Aquabacterium sp.]